MSSDTGDHDGEMVKLNVTVPKRLLDELDELVSELDFPNRSEFVRAVLRETTEPILTPGAQEGVTQGYVDVAGDRTLSIAAARERLGLEDNGE